MADAGPQAPLGILAGGTRLPIEIAEAARGRGQGVHIVGLEGEADAAIASFPHTWVNWGAIGAMIRAFREAGCRDIVIVGRVRRPNLMKLRPDGLFWRTLPSLFGFLRGGDDTILRMVIRFFEKHGLTVRGIGDVAPELVAPGGCIAGAEGNVNSPGIATACRALDALARFDASQAAVADHSGRLLALEGADGTDAMLVRLAGSRADVGQDRGGVVVKLPKIGQEMRIDLPTIGPETARRASEARLDSIAIAAGSTVIADRAGLARVSQEMEISVLGLERGAAPGSDGQHIGAQPRAALVVMVPAPARHAGDVQLGLHVIAALAPFWPEATVVVSRGYVLAIEGPGGAVDAAGRSGRLKPWGARILRRRVGVVVTSDRAPRGRALIASAKRSGLAGIVVADATAAAALLGEARSAGLFVIETGRVE